MVITLKFCLLCFCEIIRLLRHAPHLIQYFINEAAMELNRDKDLDSQPPVYAMLSDMRDFYFLSYDGTQFRVMSEISVVQ